MNIQKIAETNFHREMSRYIQDIDEESESSESDEEPPRPQIIQIQAEEEEKPVESEQKQESAADSAPAEPESPPQNPNILPMGRSGYARSLLQPVNIPVQMMPKGEAVETSEAAKEHSASEN